MKSNCKSTPQPIIVLGAERSGTSVVTEMVYRWGAYPGEFRYLREADEKNRQGYWEYTPIWDFLEELGVNWWDVCFQEEVREKALLPRYREKALNLVAAMEKERRPWVWKDPALCFFLPFWKEIWGDVAYIILVRNPQDTARSWQEFVLPAGQEDSVNLIAQHLLRWQYMMLLVLEHMEETGRKIFISYEELVEEPLREARRLDGFLNRVCGVKGSEDVKIERMARCVDAKLRHNRSRVPFDRVEEATGEQKALYEFVRRKIEDPRLPFQCEKYPMPAGWREFVKQGEALARSYRGEA